MLPRVRLRDTDASHGDKLLHSRRRAYVWLLVVLHVGSGHAPILVLGRQLLVELLAACIGVHVVGVHGRDVLVLLMVLLMILRNIGRRRRPSPRVSVSSMPTMSAVNNVRAMARHRAHVASTVRRWRSTPRHGLPSRQMTMAHPAGVGVAYGQ